MESRGAERKVQVAAGIVGLVAVAALLFLRGRSSGMNIRILSQSVSFTVYGWDSEQQYARQGVAIRYEVMPRHPEEVLYNKTDVAGDGFRCETMSLGPYSDGVLVPFGYAHPPLHPRLELWKDNRRVAWVPLADFPVSPRNDLVAKSDQRIRAVRYLNTNYPSESGLKFATGIPMGKNEIWSVQILRSDHQNGPTMRTSLRYAGRLSDPIALPWAEDARVAEIEVQRAREILTTRDFQLAGLRLVDHNGMTAINVPHGFRFKDSENGFVLSVPAQELGPNRRTRGFDVRSPIAFGYLRDTFSAPKPPASGPELGSTSGFWRRREGYEEWVSISLVSPRPERLNLRAITIGGSLKTLAKPTGVVVRTPFTVVLRVTIQRTVPFDTFRATLPVEKGDLPSDRVGKVAYDIQQDTK